MRAATLVPRVLVLFAGLSLAAPSARADGPCSVRICVAEHHFRGGQDGGRCQSEPDFFTRAMSHYLVDGPICPAGWRVDGDNCSRNDCCFRRACRRDERFRNGFCHRGPTFFGWRSHYRPSCREGEVLEAATGLCRREGCDPGGPRPVTAEERRSGARRAESELERREPPPPPAVRGRHDGSLAAIITGCEPRACINEGAAFTVRGARFGAQQGARHARLGGHGISVTLPVRSWSDERIVVQLPDDRRIEHGQWYYVGIQDGQGQWISNIDKNIDVCHGPE
jgi:hypothetical protein